MVKIRAILSLFCAHKPRNDRTKTGKNHSLEPPQTAYKPFALHSFVHRALRNLCPEHLLVTGRRGRPPLEVVWTAAFAFKLVLRFEAAHDPRAIRRDHFLTLWFFFFPSFFSLNFNRRTSASRNLPCWNPPGLPALVHWFQLHQLWISLQQRRSHFPEEQLNKIWFLLACSWARFVHDQSDLKLRCNV